MDKPLDRVGRYHVSLALCMQNVLVRRGVMGVAGTGRWTNLADAGVKVGVGPGEDYGGVPILLYTLKRI